MSVSSIGSLAGPAQQLSTSQAKTTESAERPGPDNDGDLNDIGGASSAQKAAPAPGNGVVVDQEA